MREGAISLTDELSDLNPHPILDHELLVQNTTKCLNHENLAEAHFSYGRCHAQLLRLLSVVVEGQ